MALVFLICGASQTYAACLPTAVNLDQPLNSTRSGAKGLRAVASAPGQTQAFCVTLATPATQLRVWQEDRAPQPGCGPFTLTVTPPAPAPVTRQTQRLRTSYQFASFRRPPAPAGPYGVQVTAPSGCPAATYLVAWEAAGQLPNQPPFARLQAPASVEAGSLVTLDGHGSRDPEGQPLTYAWTQTAGPPVTLSGATRAQATFTAPMVTVATLLRFRLTVTDPLQMTAGGEHAVTVSAPAPDTTPPTITLTFPIAAGGTFTTAEPTINIGASITDAGRGVNPASVQWRNMTTGTSGPLLLTGYGWVGQYTPTGGVSTHHLPVQQGTNAFTVTARDMAGNTATVNFTVILPESTPLTCPDGIMPYRLEGAVDWTPARRKDTALALGQTRTFCHPILAAHGPQSFEMRVVDVRESSLMRFEVFGPDGQRYHVSEGPSGSNLGEYIYRNLAVGTWYLRITNTGAAAMDNVRVYSAARGYLADQPVIGGPPTPAPAASCNMGELPLATHPTYPPGTRGKTGIAFRAGETQTWCVNVDRVTPAMTVSLASQGVPICLDVRLTIIPPAGYTPQALYAGEGTDTSAGAFDAAPLQQGIWRIRVEDRSTSCAATQYQLFSVY